MMSSHFKRSMTTVAGTCTLAAALLAGVSGCDNSDAQARDQVSDAIAQAVAELNQLHIGGNDIGDAASREQAYRKLSSIVAANTSDGEMLPEQKQARQAIAAIAKLGLAEIEMQRATDADIVAIRMTHELYGLLGSATQYGAKQHAAGSFDFTDTLREIEREQSRSVARKDELLLQAKSLERQMADLDSMIKSELGEYERLREESVVARDKAADAPLEQRQAIIEDAAGISRDADAHQVKAANAEAAYDMMVPQLAELRNRIAQTETELLSFENTRRQIEQRKASLDREVAQNSADVQSTIGEIDAKFRALVTHQSEQLEPRYVSGIDLAGEAVSALNSARAGQSNLPRLKLVHAQQLLGQLHWQRAQSLQRYAQLVAGLAENADLLQRGGEDAALLDELRSQIDLATQAAAAAFEEAFQAADSASLSPETLTQLQELKARVSGEEYVPPVEEQPEAEIVADDTVAVASTGTPADCINAVLQRVRDDRFAAALDHIKFDSAKRSHVRSGPDCHRSAPCRDGRTL
ncbi:MAG: hypothetical protein HND57_08665 [Planctomycetes bacterium]|nr:hypothetical protein [Planctomycetota bacterium]